MKLTAANIRDLSVEPGKTDRIEFDDDIPGFGFRVRNTGFRGWVYQFKLAGKSHRIPIGKASAVKAGRAREIAAEYYARVKLGQNPAIEKYLKVERARHTFAGLVERYLAEQRSQLRPNSYREIARHLQTHALPLHPLPLDAVEQRVVAERLTHIARNSGAVTANRVRATMSAMFGWGMREGLALANPIANTNKREEKSRDRVLGDNELRAVWNAVGDGDYGTIVKLLALTGQRANEIAGLCWSEIDFDRGVISLPGLRTKNGRPHEIPMARQVRALLETRCRTEGRDLVFGRGDGPFSGFSRCKGILDKSLDLRPWVLHDLRRSVATGMADIGIQPHIIEAVLNHVGQKSGVAGIYNRSSYTKEKVEALARWDEHVASIVGGKR